MWADWQREREELGFENQNFASMADEVLQEKHYVEGCPGCKVDMRKQSTSGFPVKELFSMWLVVLCNGKRVSFMMIWKCLMFCPAEIHVFFHEGFLSFCLSLLLSALPISSLYPFLYFMIRDFHVAKRDEDIGCYAGYVGAALMLGRVFTSVFWGVIADLYGRKPVIIFGIVSVIILNTLFGLSINIWMALATRFLLGLFKGLLGPIKAYAVELSRKEYQAMGLSVVSSA
uniref:Major facilitator superfamily (MFS) profile domain-containing protein n=1 Tax=Kalanchoe fedtschenkoi TaxID=63787 RepID=A0A7N0U456_KALFE